jgi:hypothetical protein
MRGAETYHDFFVASGGVAGALIGLLFVAMSVAREPEEVTEAYAHRVRAAGALTAFTNALVVSLFALIPEMDIGWPVAGVAVVGVLFIARSIRERLAMGHASRPGIRDISFLAGLMIIFGFQAVEGIRLIADEDNPDPLETVAILVVMCFLFGVARAWEMIGGPSMGHPSRRYRAKDSGIVKDSNTRTQ